MSILQENKCYDSTLEECLTCLEKDAWSRDLIEHQILWKPKMELSLFWFDYWTGLGALYFITPPEFYCDEYVHNVYDVVNEGA